MKFPLNLTILLLISLSAACTRQVYIPVESNSVSHSDLTAIKARIDTVINSDTVTITLTTAGDTISNTITRWRTRTAIIRDTISITRTDTIVRQIPVTAPVSSAAHGKTLSTVVVIIVAGVWLYTIYKASKPHS